MVSSCASHMWFYSPLFLAVILLSVCGFQSAHAQKCAATKSVKPSRGDPTFWCGVDYEHALDCHTPCETGDSRTCPAGEICFAKVLACKKPQAGSPKQKRSPRHKNTFATKVSRAAASSNYCGVTYSDALDCQRPCPNLTECPPGETCFGGIVCTPPNPLNWCGTDYTHASDCHKDCPFGTTGECPAGEHCITSVTACEGASPTGSPTSSPDPTSGPEPTNAPAPAVKGFWKWEWNSNSLPAFATLSTCLSGWVDVDETLKLCSDVYHLLVGTRYVAFGGGESPNFPGAGDFTKEGVQAITKAITDNRLSAYEGISYDIEIGDPGLTPYFLESFAAAKAAGFEVMVTISHSAPYAVPDAAVLMDAVLASTDVDMVSPQLYTSGMEPSNDYDISQNYGWENYKNSKPIVVPSMVWADYYADGWNYFNTNYQISIDGYIQWQQ